MDNNVLIEQVEKFFTFSGIFFESCAFKLVQCVFETLPVATRFNPDSMGFLIEVNFPKCPTLGLGCQNLGNFGNFVTFVAKFEERYSTFTNCVLNALLVQRSGH